MIPLPCRTKGGAPLLGARRDGEAGPFGVRTAEPDPGEDDVDDGQDHEQHDQGGEA